VRTRCTGRGARRALAAEVAPAGGRRLEALRREVACDAFGALAELAFLDFARFAPLLRAGAGAASFCARRTRFQALRAAVDCLRARLASRFASFRRLRARFSSSFAIRTRCFATSACSRALSRGSAGRLVGSLSLFFIFGAREARKAGSLTQLTGGCHSAGKPSGIPFAVMAFGLLALI
jgi:hypothetical protein